jgi:hypothetical protein
VLSQSLLAQACAAEGEEGEEGEEATAVVAAAATFFIARHWSKLRMPFCMRSMARIDGSAQGLFFLLHEDEEEEEEEEEEAGLLEFPLPLLELLEKEGVTKTAASK